ncbi:MAG: EamA protein [Patescibacteria group bacterium]|nr:EamA protein [Patescibacteria group bacterium]
MNWFLIALVAPFLWAIVNIADNYLVAKFSEKDKEKSSGGLVLFSSLIGIVIALFIWFFVQDVWSVSGPDKLLLLLSGTLTIIWIILYLFALEVEDTSLVVPWFLAVPVFGYVLGALFLGESLTSNQLLGSVIIFFGLIIISFDWRKDKKTFKKKPAFYMLFASFAIALSGILFKYVTIEGDFWVSSFWEYLGLGITGIFIYTLMPHYRNSFHNMNKSGGYKIFAVNIISELMSISGNILTNFALLLAPAAMVFLVGSFQPAIVLVLTVVGTRFLPHIIKEDISSGVLVPKVAGIIVMTLGSVILFI